MTVRWTHTAARDLEQVYLYIANDNAAAAIRTINAIVSGVEALEKNPQLGRSSRLAGTRELIFAPYIVSYRLRRQSIEILSIIHGSRRWH